MSEQKYIMELIFGGRALADRGNGKGKCPAIGVWLTYSRKSQEAGVIRM